MRRHLGARPESPSPDLGRYAFRALRLLVISLWLTTAALGQENPTQTVHSDAFLQGGLVDLRWGQASVDRSGTGVLMEWNEDSLFTLNGEKTTTKTLAGILKKGTPLGVGVRYDRDTARILWMDAYDSTTSGRIDLKFPHSLAVGEVSSKRLIFQLPTAERKRLQLRQPRLFVPGLLHSAPLQDGQALLPVQVGWEWRKLPIYVRDGHRLFRAHSSTLSTEPMEILDWGPDVVAFRESSFPGWIDFGRSYELIDYRSIRITASNGGKVSQIQLRSSRLGFKVQPREPGTMVIKLSLRDRFGRPYRLDWSVEVRP